LGYACCSIPNIAVRDGRAGRDQGAVSLAERDPKIRVIVLRGAGRAFSGGYDFGDGLLNNGIRNGTLTIDIDNRTLRAEP
jgi:hypothetical protein